MVTLATLMSRLDYCNVYNATCTYFRRFQIQHLVQKPLNTSNLFCSPSAIFRIIYIACRFDLFRGVFFFNELIVMCAAFDPGQSVL